MAEQRQVPENLPIGGSDKPSIKIQEPKEGLEGIKEMLSSIFSKGDKAARATLGPAAAPAEGLLSLFDLRDVPSALSSAGKDLQSGVTEGDPKAMLAGVLGTALVGAENVPGVGKAGKSINELMTSYPELKKQWWLDEADETGYVTLYHGADANELDSIFKTGLRPDREGFAYTSPDAPTSTAYSVMGGGEKKFKDMDKDAQEVSAENRITIELKVPIEEVRKNFDNQRSKRSKETLLGVTGKEQLVTSESLDKAKKKFLDSPFDPERGPIKIDTQNNLKFKTPFYELSEFRFKGGLSPEYITGISQKPKVKRTDVAEDKDLNSSDFIPKAEPPKKSIRKKEISQKDFKQDPTNIKESTAKIKSVMGKADKTKETKQPSNKKFNAEELANLIRLAVKKKKGGSVVERNPYNYTAKAI